MGVGSVVSTFTMSNFLLIYLNYFLKQFISTARDADLICSDGNIGKTSHNASALSEKAGLFEWMHSNGVVELTNVGPGRFKVWTRGFSIGEGLGVPRSGPILPRPGWRAVSWRRDFGTTQRLPVPHPSRLLDPNPIKNVWAAMGRLPPRLYLQ